MYARNSKVVLTIGGNDCIWDPIHPIIAATNGCRCDSVSDGEEALNCIRTGNVAVALVCAAEVHGELKAARFLFELSLLDKHVPSVIVSKQFDTDCQLDFRRMGADDCMTVPINSNKFSFLLEKLVSSASHDSTALAIHGHGNYPSHSSGDGAFLVGSNELSTIWHHVQHVAPLDTTILLTGETGTGKTRLSRMIHDLSQRSSKPFLTVNCGALSGSLIESELFGHSRGAFTSADRDRVGKLELAQDGTLLLDDIDATPEESQPKLLRAVEERVFEPVGSNRTQRVRARLIVATNRCLEDEVNAGRFRSDLFYRLNVVAFHLPPLRERRDEIHSLAKQFIEEMAQKHKLSTARLTDETVRALQTYDWPGNVRELRNIIERAVVLCRSSTIDASVLTPAIQACATSSMRTHTKHESGVYDLARARDEAERTRLLEALRCNGNNRSRTADELGISRTALYKKLHKFGLS